MKSETIKRQQITMTVLLPLLIGGLAVYHTLNPAPNDHYALAALYLHPIASLLGALLPAVISAPLVYWMLGRILRRIATRYKVCERCAETIKSDAKVCRYCGRDVAPVAAEDKSAVSIGGPTAQTLKGAGTILAGIVVFVAFIFLMALYIAGVAWVSKGVRDYLDVAAITAFEVCVLVLLPCALFRATRTISVYGLFISSVIFGASIWILGFLATLQYWGGFGVFVGLIMGVVGIVPIGMLASALHGDWPAFGMLALGLVLTFGARMAAVMVAVRMDRDEAGIVIAQQATVHSTVTDTQKSEPIDQVEWTKRALNWLRVMWTHGIVKPLTPKTFLENEPTGPAIVARPVIVQPPPSLEQKTELTDPVIVGQAVRSARADNVSAADEERVSRKPPQPSRLALRTIGAGVTAFVLGLVLVGSVVVRLSNTERTSAPIGTPVTADAFTTAYRRGDYVTTLRLIRPLAEQGDSSAQFLLGLMYADGRGVPQNYAEAVKWYRLAADQGDAHAQYHLGDIYAGGWGLQNYAEALKWYRKAADQDDPRAQFSLGSMYANGHGVAQNDTEAVKWYRKAADQGFALAQNFLGEMCYTGRGVAQNYVNAHMWFSLASAQGEQDAVSAQVAVKHLHLVEQSMTSGQIAEAQKLADEWEPKSTPRAAAGAPPGARTQLTMNDASKAIQTTSSSQPHGMAQSTSGSFDGRWSATVGPQGPCNFTSLLILDVVGSSIVGNATNPLGVFPLSGAVNPNGAGVFKIGGFVGTIRFLGNTFEANYANSCGGRFAIGSKRTAGNLN